MLNKIKKTVISLLVTLLLISNVSAAVDKVRFEVMKKPEITLPMGIKKILIADNYVSKKGYRHHDFVYNNRAFIDDHNIDSLLSISATDGFRNVINSTGLYAVNDDKLYLSPSDTSRSKYPINRATAVNLMKEHEAELMFVLHNIDVIDVLEIEDYSSYYMADFIIHYISSWKRYDLNDSVYHSYNFKADTVQYRGSGYTEDNTLTNIPDRYTAIGYAAFKAGQEMAKVVSPHWESVERQFYTFSIPELMLANTMLKDGRIKEAVETWRKYVNDKNKYVAWQIAFNMAVACEMLDKLDIANEWIDKSIAIKQNKYNMGYKSILTKRINDRGVMKWLY